jgi:glycosyltransferase involved in cell wall biosynthesis
MVDTVQKRGWQDRVTFTGPVMDERLLDIMRKVDVLVMPSSFEGFGIAYLEGMGMGLPAIATTAGAAHEIITHGKDGFLIPPENPTVLAEKLNQLIHTPKRLETMSLAALDRYRAFPNWETSMAAIRSFLVPFTS